MWGCLIIEVELYFYFWLTGFQFIVFIYFFFSDVDLCSIQGVSHVKLTSNFEPIWNLFSFFFLPEVKWQILFKYSLSAVIFCKNWFYMSKKCNILSISNSYLCLLCGFSSVTGQRNCRRSFFKPKKMTVQSSDVISISFISYVHPKV